MKKRLVTTVLPSTYATLEAWRAQYPGISRGLLIDALVWLHRGEDLSALIPWLEVNPHGSETPESESEPDKPDSDPA